MTKSAELDPDVAQRRKRIEESFALNKKALETAEKEVDRLRDARRDLILLALAGASEGANVFTYDEVAALTGVTRSAVYKIVRNGYKDAPLGEQRQSEAPASA